MERRSLLLALLIIAAAVLWHFANAPIQVADDSATTISQQGDSSRSKSVAQASDQAVISDNANCLSESQFETHPMFVNDFERTQWVMDNGPAFESYRGLSRHEVGALAEQGDSAAMLVLGVMAELRGRGVSTERAVDYINLADESLNTYRVPTNRTDEWREAQQEAANWYYKAALHGRVMALSRYGDLLWWTVGGPVELGWLSREEYELLNRNETNALLPLNAYVAVAYELLPELSTGIMGELGKLRPSQTERTRPVIEMLKDEFLVDLQQANLKLPSVAASQLPPIETMMDMICPEVFEALEVDQ